MITAAYTICKNELKYVEKWLYYTKDFTYRCILDTGSTDGTYEAFADAAKTDSNLILEQKTFTPWKFDVARKYNLAMVPQEVNWCLSPDLDEYFSINVLDEMKKTISERPDVTNIACDRLDLYSYTVRVGPPNMLPTNKIHRRHDYTWSQPIYEHLIYAGPNKYEVEIYNDDIYLIHDQDFKKQVRSDLYIRMLREEYDTNPTNCWTLWYLLTHYFKEQDLNNYVDCGITFMKHSNQDERHQQVKGILTDIYLHQPINTEQKQRLLQCLRS